MTKLPAQIGPSNNLQRYECPLCGEQTISGTTMHAVSRGDMIRLRCPCGWRDVRPLKTNNPAIVDVDDANYENNRRLENAISKYTNQGMTIEEAYEAWHKSEEGD